MLRPDDYKIAAMLLRASWQLQGVGHQFSKLEREEMAGLMREMAHALLPKETDSMAGAAEYYRPGVYNGD
jgi:hypothetical protein